MTSLRAGPTGTTSSPFGSGSSSSDGLLYTPASDRSEEEEEEEEEEEDGPSSSRPSRPTIGSLKVQTDFSDDADLSGSSDDGLDDGYDSYDDIRPNSSRDSHDFLKYTIEEEQQVVKRFDRKLVPFLALLYLLSFLDRSNIGNAKIAGMEEDLQLSSSQYEWLLTAFYITYILFEWMTLMYRLVPAHIYISLCVFGWGLVASFQSLATSFGALVFLRAALGITEAAFGPGVPFYLSQFYKREELAFRNGLFISAAPLASSFASSLAWVIVKFSSGGPIAPWRTLFLVEGFPSVIVAVFAWLWIPDSPGTARFLDSRQKMIAQLRMDDSSSGSGSGTSSRRLGGSFNWGEVKKTLADPKAYITAFMFFSCNVAFSSMPVFLPTIIAEMGYTPLQSQALSAPPYLLAFVSVLLTAYYSDRQRRRSPFLIAHALVSATAYLTLALTGHYHGFFSDRNLTTHQNTLRYVSLYPAIAGFFSAITLIITWSMDNRAAQEGKGASVALLNLVGQCGPLLGTRLYPAREGPWYVRGMGVCAGCMVLVAVLAVVLRGMLGRENRRVQQGKQGGGALGGEEFEMERRAGGEESEVLIFGERRRGRRMAVGEVGGGYIL
ncbi:MFS general substrate transporter [Aspergillus violaceofuscus CBS 115571]|uniref:MFS general substrate transporter n=1 Tax=Aspergillus violaceofuscus (strain CBS 115571) TaxID=1450538 RepID=A0A2V5GU29_ASPV1|nr:MFS general substrate transporter [Aspergillus violaceofuscus CBS 115571]